MQFAVRTDQRADALPLLQMLEKLLHVHLHRTMDGTVVAAPLVVLSGGVRSLLIVLSGERVESDDSLSEECLTSASGGSAFSWASLKASWINRFACRNASFLGFSLLVLCLTRACLGKMTIIKMYFM
jgi:hypothetical protein